jgi:hypothetical protein
VLHWSHLSSLLHAVDCFCSSKKKKNYSSWKDFGVAWRKEYSLQLPIRCSEHQTCNFSVIAHAFPFYRCWSLSIFTGQYGSGHCCKWRYWVLHNFSYFSFMNLLTLFSGNLFMPQLYAAKFVLCNIKLCQLLLFFFFPMEIWRCVNEQEVILTCHWERIHQFTSTRWYWCCKLFCCCVLSFFNHC